jgi:hypothetical protein
LFKFLGSRFDHGGEIHLGAPFSLDYNSFDFSKLYYRDSEPSLQWLDTYN